MKTEELYNGITDINDAIIAQAYTHNFKKRSRKRWLVPIAAVLVFAIIAGAVLWPIGGSTPSILNSYAITEAEYPTRAMYPRDEDYIDENGEVDWEAYNTATDLWLEERTANRWNSSYSDGVKNYIKTSVPTFLSTDKDENRVYSPLNVYMALGMLAELTDGDSRQQILDLTGAADIQTQRAVAQNLWNAKYTKDGISTSLLASSLWLNEAVTFKKETMQTLANTYYASSYKGKMGSPTFNEALQSWLNAQTGDALKEQASTAEMSPDTLLALATTVLFQARWDMEFQESNTVPAVFHTKSGDITCDFMHQSAAKAYYWGDKFTATAQQLDDGSAMYFILPDEGVSVEDLLSDTQAMDFMVSGMNWEKQEYVTVNLSVPKFDVSSQLDLQEGLKALGVTDVFDPQKSDFTPMTAEQEDIMLSEVKHAARVNIDEEGCTAAAFTLMLMEGTGGPPPKEVDFTLDRPFLFAITGTDGLPLFVGIVNQP